MEKELSQLSTKDMHPRMVFETKVKFGRVLQIRI